MGATSTDISNYIVSIRDAHALFSDKVAKKEMLGHTDVFCSRQKLCLLGIFVEIIERYFSQATYDIDGYFVTSYNFFDTDEIHDIEQHINNICDTNYIIENL